MTREPRPSAMCFATAALERCDPGAPPNDSNDDFEQIAVLAAGAMTIGIPRAGLLAVKPLQKLVFSGNGPPWLLGITEHTEQWLVVISIVSWIRGAVVAPNQTSKVAVVTDRAGRTLGLLVDAVIGFRDVYRSELRVRSTLPEGAPCVGAPCDLVLGITQDRLQLIDLERVFADEALSRERLRNFVL